MGEWKEVKLDALAEVKGGKRLPKGKLLTTAKTNHPYIRITDFDGFKINLDNIQYVEDDVQVSISRYIVNSGDIILSNVGTLGLVAIVPPELDNANLTENCVKILLQNNEIDNKFLYYQLVSPDMQDLIIGLDVGSTQPKLPMYNIKNMDISLPPLKEQKAIAEVLSSLDDKIDLLHSQNKTLEALAQTLFRQWFIEEAGDEWEITTLGSFGKAVTGKTPSTKNSDYWGEEISFITPTDFKYYGKYSTFSDRSLSIAGKNKVKNSVLPKDSILVTCIGSDMGKVAIAQNQCVTNQQINSLIINDLFTLEYVYQHLKYSYPLLRAIAMGGTTMPIINKTDFENIEIPLPTNDLIKKFHNITSPFNEKIIKNTNQIKTLENMRDTLLPKLMSGEVRVKYE